MPLDAMGVCGEEVQCVVIRLLEVGLSLDLCL